MSIGTPQISTADLTLAGRRALTNACSVVTHRAIEDLANSASEQVWLAGTTPPTLAADVRDPLVARRCLATLVAVGQKLMDPRPLPAASLAELWACWLIWREALPTLGATEERPALDRLARAIQVHSLDLGGFERLYGSQAAALLDDLPPFIEWFEAVDEVYPVHPYVALTEEQARRATDDEELLLGSEDEA